MDAPTDRLAERTRRILNAAAEAFHEKGFHGVGVDEIGRRAGLSGPSLYRVFAGKDEILARLLDEAMDELLGATAADPTDPVTALERALRQHLHYAVEHRQLVLLYQREVRSLSQPWRAALDRRRAQHARQWQLLFLAAFPTLDPAQASTASQACLGMVFSVAAWPSEVARAAHVRDLVVDLIHHGLDSLGEPVSPASP